jgi:hypothetical protein
MAFIIFLNTGCAQQKVPVQAQPKEKTSGTLLYQNKLIYGFKIAPSGKKMLIVIKNALVIFDLKNVKPILNVQEKGLNTAPTNILWSPDSKKVTIIFTGDINRIIFLDVAKAQIQDLYVKNLLDLAWADNKNLLYKVKDDTEYLSGTESLFQIPVFSKQPKFVTAVKPEQEDAVKMLLINNFNGFLLKKDDQILAVQVGALAQPKSIADLQFRHSKGYLTRNVSLEDKNENGMLLRKIGFVSVNGKIFNTTNDLLFLDTLGKHQQNLTQRAVNAKLLSGGLVLKRIDGSIALFDLADKKERNLPGNWENYAIKVQADYWANKKAVVVKEKASKNGQVINKLVLYMLK